MKQADIPNRNFMSSFFDAFSKNEMNSKNNRFFDRRMIRCPIAARFERLPRNVTASGKKKVEKDLLCVRIQKEANKTTK